MPPAPVPARAGALTAPSAADVLSGLVARGRGAATARTLLRAASAAGCVTDACVFAAAELRRAGAAGELLGPDDRSAVAAAYRAALRPLRETLSLCEAVAAGAAPAATAVEAPSASVAAAIEAVVATRASSGRVQVGGSSSSRGSGGGVGGTPAAVALAATVAAAERGLLAIVVGLLSHLGGKTGQLRLAEAAAEASPASAAPAVFWHKLCGDLCRYAAEGLGEAAAIARYSDLGLSHYSKAQGLARGLHAASADVLGVALNFSVFLFEVRRCRSEAADFARGALDAAADATQPQTAEEHAAGDAIYVLIEENLRFWAQQVAREEAAAAAAAATSLDTHGLAGK